MPSRNELKKISRTRLKEAKALYQNRLYDGAKYLSGYAVETALKARICKNINEDYPEKGEIAKSFLTHKFDVLIRLGGLQKAFESELVGNVNFKLNWSLLSNWNESFRYSTIGNSTQSEIEEILNALEHKNDGVLTWIMKKW